MVELLLSFVNTKGREKNVDLDLAIVCRPTCAVEKLWPSSTSVPVMMSVGRQLDRGGYPLDHKSHAWRRNIEPIFATVIASE